MLKKDYKNASISLLITVISAVLLSLSMCFVPFVSEEQSVYNYVLGAVVWITFLAIIISSISTDKTLRKFRKKLVSMNVLEDQRMPGIFNFEGGFLNIVLYSVILIGLVLIITDIIFVYMPEFIMFPILSITIITFTLHCIADGKNYKVYKIIKESIRRDAKH